MSRSGGRLWVSRVDATLTDPHVIRSKLTSLIGWGHLPGPPAFAMYTGSTQLTGSGWLARVRGISLPLPLLVLLISILPTARGAISCATGISRGARSAGSVYPVAIIFGARRRAVRSAGP